MSWLAAIKQWPGMPEQWRRRPLDQLCKRGIECTGRYWTHARISGYCSWHCWLEDHQEGRVKS